MTEFNLENENLYELLNININSTANEIKKAYRKKALECHPDKNLDNPNAAIEFRKLTKVLEILIDDSARAIYDKVLKARQDAKIRHEQLDSKRRKLKEELEAREKASRSINKDVKLPEQQLKEEIERLRREGSKQVEEEMNYIMKKIREEQMQEDNDDTSSKYRIKIKWKATKRDPKNGGYTEELLHQFLSKYGDINILIISPKKTGSALVEFKTLRAAEMAIDFEKGLSTNPLELNWVAEPPSRYRSSTIKESDFENIVLTKMRQAEERKKLIEQIMREDADDT